MAQITMIAALTGIAIALAGALGCNSQQDTSPQQPAAAAQNEKAEKQQAEIDKQLAKLSATDREFALAQKICPISEEPLGSMGKPVKVTVQGHDVFLCCAGCEGKLTKNFDEYRAKLGKPATDE